MAGLMRDCAITLENEERRRPDRRCIYAIALIALLTIHAALTLQLFGRFGRWANLVNGEPITCGRHPLHLEEGSLGPTTAFDPSGYAGYPPTAVFDAQSRPAAWLEEISGGIAGPGYKIGLALGYWLVPAVLWFAAIILRAGWETALAAAGLGVCVAWSGPAVDMIEAGEIWVPLVGVLAVLALALLGRWHICPGLGSWCGLLAIMTLGWALDPSPWAAIFVLSLGLWAFFACWHGPKWHTALAVVQIAALALSYADWRAWLHDWWIRLSITGLMPALPLPQTWALALWLTVLPAAWVVTQIGRRIAALPNAGLIVGSALFLVTAGMVMRPKTLGWPVWGPRPLTIGFHGDALQLEDAVRAASPADARVLWEDLPGRPDLGWTALLPRRLDRSFVGGLDPEGVLEHGACALRRQFGRPAAGGLDRCRTRRPCAPVQHWLRRLREHGCPAAVSVLARRRTHTACWVILGLGAFM